MEENRVQAASWANKLIWLFAGAAINKLKVHYRTTPVMNYLMSSWNKRTQTLCHREVFNMLGVRSASGVVDDSQTIITIALNKWVKSLEVVKSREAILRMLRWSLRRQTYRCSNNRIRIKGYILWVWLRAVVIWTRAGATRLAESEAKTFHIAKLRTSRRTRRWAVSLKKTIH